MMAAMKRNDKALMSKEDLVRSSNRMRGLYEKQRADFDRAARGPVPDSGGRRTFRERTGEEWQEPSDELERLPEGAESDAAKAAREFEAALTKTKDAKAIRKMTKRIDDFETKAKEYQEALPDFFERMDFEGQQAQEEFTVEGFDHMKSVEGYKQFFNNVMKAVRESPGRESLEKELKAAGIKSMSFDDVVILAPNKKKFDKAWRAYVNVAQQVSAGAGGIGRTPMAGREHPVNVKEA